MDLKRLSWCQFYVKLKAPQEMAHQQLSGSSPVALCSPRWVSVSVLQSVSSACAGCGVALSVKVDPLGMSAVIL